MLLKHRFARSWIIAALVALGSVAAINRLIDPYSLYAGPRWPGINAIKPRPERTLEDIKLANALRQDADVVILGNSRADYGLDPRHPLFRRHGQRPYNLATPGSTLEAGARQLETMVAEGCIPKLVVAGVEFFDYLDAPPAASRPTEAEPGAWASRALRLQLQGLLTLAALGDSVATLQAQRKTYPATVRDDGFNPLLDYLAIARNEGYHAIFRQRGIANARRLKAAKAPADLRDTASHAALTRLLAVARERQIRLELVIYPYHAQTLGLLHHYGLLPEYAAWQAALAATVDAAAAQGTDVRLWNFAVVDARTSEPIPKPGDRSSDTEWYWDAGHFKPKLGNLMVDLMLANPDAKSDFGYLLAPGPAAPPDLGRQVAALLSARPDLAGDLQEIVGAVR